MYQNRVYVLKRRLNYLVWLLLCMMFLFFFVGPFVWMVTTSFKTPADIIRFPPRLFPELWVVDNYVTMWEELNWLPMFANSFWITGVSVFLLVMVSALGGFSFAKMRWPLRTFCFLLIIAGLIVPTEVDMVPRFLMMTSWGLTGTYIPVILLIIGQGFQTFMIRQFIGTIPDDYFDAAKVDGMGYVWMFVKIVLPLSKPKNF